MATPKKIRVLIADARPVFRMGLRLLLQKEADISVVGETDRGDQVIKKVTALKPNVIVLHARLGEANGRSILQQIHRNHSKSRLLILISSDQEEDQVKALRLAAAHIVPKHAPARLLVQWIRQSDDATAKSEAAEAGGRPADDENLWAEEPKDNSPLSARERQVVELVSQGFKNREIAQRMFISEQTVKNHLHNIFDKLGVSDRLELALYAIHKNLQSSE
ncbi:MAG: response regulator transcription factor [Acidobacteria bacterium]|nr:response regulator transcription factor [Acidobacteriota bacterium]